jgi:recombination protein RecT
MASTQIVPIAQKFDNVKALISRNKSALMDALAKTVTFDRMINAFYLCVRKNPKLLDCTEQSIMGALLETGNLGLEPGGSLGQAYLVPFKNNKAGGRLEVQLIAGYKGLLKLVRNTGELASITAEVVYRQDELFEYGLGSEPFVKHVPTEAEIPTPIWDQIRAAYAVARMKDGTIQFQLVLKRDLVKARKRSKSSDEGPWVTDPEEMCKKTAIRRLAKLLPASAEAHRLVAYDEQAELGLSQDLGSVFGQSAGEPVAAVAAQDRPKSTLDAIVQNGRKKQAAPPANGYANPNYSDVDPEPPPADSSELPF